MSSKEGVSENKVKGPVKLDAGHLSSFHLQVVFLIEAWALQGECIKESKLDNNVLATLSELITHFHLTHLSVLNPSHPSSNMSTESESQFLHFELYGNDTLICQAKGDSQARTHRAIYATRAISNGDTTIAYWLDQGGPDTFGYVATSDADTKKDKPTLHLTGNTLYDDSHIEYEYKRTIPVRLNNVKFDPQCTDFPKGSIGLAKVIYGPRTNDMMDVFIPKGTKLRSEMSL
ncbi:hypothetical protein I302_102047 [Kwoniella bestiolae CBS 10118]|uniref:Uncharacterized protein n=1 Tax=Kwoniella bestiolae CBS 10118 TaxID=1296100 RepID=A0A1B9GDY8_9TREE|nr:hypothetical protein I302_00732 [Kwoniella bestiolae CBS 10118]OCF29236.1 hypothetical protein I302_00732 [Kwoniella bestiolae CBS 10118]